jgi:hypothetical protein
VSNENVGLFTARLIFELRAALSLAKLYRTTGRSSGVRELLAATVTGFTEGPEAPEVDEVDRLLGSLDAPNCLMKKSIRWG